jgi:RNA polymerase sigma-70 factor (ECF subfamily)
MKHGRRSPRTSGSTVTPAPWRDRLHPLRVGVHRSPTSNDSAPTNGCSDSELLARVRAGEEQAFVELVWRYHGSLLRLARTYVKSHELAEEVAQDTWLGVLRGLDGFAERSTFKTWLLGILLNCARSTGVREHRSVAIGAPGPAVEASRFDSSGNWLSPPQHWVEDSDDRLVAETLSATLRTALDELPVHQRQVVLLRDVEGLSGHEACGLLDISEANQRVLLHRGRSRLRQAIEAQLAGA